MYRGTDDRRQAQDAQNHGQGTEPYKKDWTPPHRMIFPGPDGVVNDTPPARCG